MFGIIRSVLPQLLAITGVMVAMNIGMALIKKNTVPNDEDFGSESTDLGKYGYQDGFEDIAEAREYGDWEEYDDDRAHAEIMNSYDPGSWNREIEENEEIEASLYYGGSEEPEIDWEGGSAKEHEPSPWDDQDDEDNDDEYDEAPWGNVYFGNGDWRVAQTKEDYDRLMSESPIEIAMENWRESYREKYGYEPDQMNEDEMRDYYNEIDHLAMNSGYRYKSQPLAEEIAEYGNREQQEGKDDEEDKYVLPF